ncbi:hypothetical protein MMC11_008845 [Xylographa trunciseda]|nr:hypothetical protein [Xylographa trunciseda]
MSSFAEATHVKAIGSHKYSGFFPEDWCIGSVPHGGYVTSCIQAAASLHFNTTLKAQQQPHTMTIYLTFLRRTSTGPATFAVKDVKLGRQTSTIHVSLTQGSGREEVVGYITHTNIATEAGISLPTNWSLLPAPYPAKVPLLNANHEELWRNYSEMPFLSFRKASAKIDIFIPRKGQLDHSIADEWIRFRNGEQFTMNSLGYVADAFPQIVESFREHAQDSIPWQHRKGKMWYPTVLLNLEIKKILPPEGVEWLFVRVRAKQIRNGRMDLEVVIVDDGGELVALSQHVCLIVGADRNLAERRDVNRDNGTKL